MSRVKAKGAAQRPQAQGSFSAKDLAPRVSTVPVWRSCGRPGAVAVFSALTADGSCASSCAGLALSDGIAS